MDKINKCTTTLKYYYGAEIYFWFIARINYFSFATVETINPDPECKILTGMQ